MNADAPPNQNLPANFKIALCQMLVSSDKDQNISRARSMIEDAAAMGAKLVVLPEIWNCPLSLEEVPKYAEDLGSVDSSPSLLMLSEVSHRHKITIVGGSIPENAGGRLYNTCCVFGSDGKMKAKHRKLHMFDIDIPGGIVFRESDTFSAGDKLTLVNTDVGCIGIGICHDIRFPELAMLYASQGAHIICYPSAFNESTGELLWELMQKARSVDNQLFVATCSPARHSMGDYLKWGHSSLVGPFGEIIATTEHDEAIVIGEVDYSLTHLSR